eukprot:COSAG01_NODE_51348_length_355_cov_1.207031_1_plen_31_part_01
MGVEFTNDYDDNGSGLLPHVIRQTCTAAAAA